MIIAATVTVLIVIWLYGFIECLNLCTKILLDEGDLK
tara:strand:+ start:3391 stop:3501 length:111 start_codon:yes stop_codon:yes gene_type:complete